MVTKKDVKFEPPRSQVVAEANAKAEVKEQLHTFVQPADSDTTADGYVAVDPIYQNHANDFDAPLQSEKGVEKDLEEEFLESVEGVPAEAGKQLSDLYVDKARVEDKDEKPADDGDEEADTEEPTGTQAPTGTENKS